MFFENTLFFVFKNGKLSFGFYLSNVFSFFFLFKEQKTVFENNYQIRSQSHKFFFKNILYNMTVNITVMYYTHNKINSDNILPQEN